MRLFRPNAGRRGVAIVAATVLAVTGAVLVVVAATSRTAIGGPPPSAAGTIVGDAPGTTPPEAPPTRSTRDRATPGAVSGDADGLPTPAASRTAPPPSSASSARSATPTAAPDVPIPTAAPIPTAVPDVPMSLPPVPDPTTITIPAISVRATLIRLGKNRDGTLQVPPNTTVAGWYTGSVPPGQIGPAVIAGHVDSYRGPGVFFRLRDLKPGQTIRIGRTDGSTAVFTIRGVRQYPKDHFPTMDVYRTVGFPALRLITCGGQFDRDTGNYLSDVVVYATLDHTTKPGA